MSTKKEYPMELQNGIKGEFKSPIMGDKNIYQLRIYKSLITNQLDGLTLHDYNENYDLYLGDTNVIVVKNK